MKKRSFIVISETGIHARPATELVIKADQFLSEIMLHADTRSINMKSIMGLMSLGMYAGQKFVMTISGPDEEKALAVLTNLLVENKLAKIDE